MDQTRLRGYLFGVLTAACWGTSPVFIRRGLEGLPSPLWGTMVGLSSAVSVYLLWLTWRRGWRRPEASIRAAMSFQVLAGVASGLGTIARTTAINLAPVVIVLPLTQTVSLFTPILAPLLLGRHLEQVTIKLIIGAICVVAGSALIIVGQNL